MKKFVASPVEVYENYEADTRLRVTNDSRFATSRGILRVDNERWKQAQRYERDTWLTYNLETATDRNEAHSIGFNAYTALPSDLGDYIEVGCGPFTNTRFIIPARHLTSLTLLDPLINDYEREHPHCSYKGWTMGGYAVTGVKSSLEAWKGDVKFDTLVMTNVLSHCYDAEAVFDNVKRAIKPGGYLVFHEDPRPFEPMELYDVGHPLVVPQAVVDEFLAPFDVLHKNGNYFIGRKPKTLASDKGDKWRK